MLKVESYKKGIVLSTVFNVFNKGLVFLNALIVSYFFSADQGADIFFYVLNSIIILGAYFTSMNSSVVIPESMRIKANNGNEASMRFLNLFIYSYTGFILTALLFVSLDPVAFFSSISQFKDDELINRRALLYLSLPLFGMICVINLLIDILASNKFFTISMVVGIVNGICSILFVLFLHIASGIHSAFYGLLASYLLNLIVLIYLMKRYLGWRFLTRKPTIEKRVWKNLGFAQLGNLASSFSAYMPFYMLSGFNSGIITALTFAMQISSLPGTLLINQFSSVAGIKFNELYAKKDFVEVNRIFLITANFLIFILIPISGLFFLYSYEIISILLDRGGFNKTSVSYAATFLKYLGLLLPMLVINTLFARLFMASHKIKEAFWYQTLSNILLIVILYFSIRYFGFIAYPLTLIGFNLANVLGCYFLEKTYFNIIQYKQVLKYFMLFTCINLLVGSIVYVVISKMHFSSNLLVLLLGAIVYLGLILIIAIKFNLNETISYFLHQLLGKVAVNDKRRN